MLNKKVQDALNQQVNAEFYAAYLYYGMRAYFEEQALTGAAHWMKCQWLEETGHANKIFEYIHERGGQAELKPVKDVTTKYESPLAAFQGAYAHEIKVTDMINKLIDLAAAEKDHATVNFLQFYVAEQVEEEASADAIVQKLKMIGDAQGGLFMLDRELGLRPFGLPVTIAGGGAQ
jgi:ferritin